jgi:hypothetical protein
MLYRKAQLLIFTPRKQLAGSVAEDAATRTLFLPGDTIPSEFAASSGNISKEVKDYSAALLLKSPYEQ